MPQVIDAQKVQIKHKGYFDFNNVTATIRKGMKKRLYGFLEKKHKYKPDEREIEIECDKKVNEYVKFEIAIVVLALDMKEVEIIKDNKKMIVNQGRVVIEMSGQLTLDWVKRFQGNEFLAALQDLYHKYVLGKRIKDEWLDTLEDDIFSLGREVRHALEMEV